MFDDRRLAASLAAVRDAEGGIRAHLEATRDSAGEQVRGLAAYRHAVALRRALENWVETRRYRAQAESQLTRDAR